MKPLLAILTALAAVLFAGCSEQTKDSIADVIIVSQDKIAFDENGGTATVSVACPSEWTADCSADWIELVPEENTLLVTAQANPTGQGRTASIALQTGADLQEISVSQAWSGSLVQLQVNAPEALEVISGGEEFAFSVSSNCEWTVGLADETDTWISYSADYENGVVEVSVAANDTGESRSGEIVVSSTDGSIVESAAVAFSQMSKSDDPYYKMTGKFSLFAENWYRGDGYLDAPGVATQCTIEEKVYPDSLVIKNLFTDGTEIATAYDKNTHLMTIDLGRLCMMMNLTGGGFRAYYPVAIDLTSRGFTAKKVTGEYGEGTDENGVTKPAIILSGFDAPYNAFGLIASDGASYAFISDLYYAVGEMYLLKADDTKVTD